MKKGVYFLSICLLLTWSAGHVLAADFYLGKKGARFAYNWWKDRAEAHSDPVRQARAKRNTIWLGDFQEEEKEAIFSFIDNETEFSLYAPVKILKTDLEGDGNSDYVLQELIIKNPQPFYYGTVFVILTKSGKGFDLKVLSTSGDSFGRHDNKLSPLKAVDFDGNGLKDILIGWYDNRDESDEDPGDDHYRTVIYQNEGGSFREVYHRKTYDYLKIKDLDGNGIPEILEPVSGAEREVYTPHNGFRWRWVNIYNLGRLGMERTNLRYPDFYREKKKEYQALEKEAREKEAEHDKKIELGLCRSCNRDTIYVALEKLMQRFIQRIDEMTQSGMKKK